MSKNATKIQELKKQIADLEAEDAAIKAMTPEQQLALTLHNKLCRWNHTDGCGWFYEMKNGIDDWNRSAHGEYLTKARTVSRFCHNHGIDTKVALDLVAVLKI